MHLIQTKIMEEQMQANRNNPFENAYRHIVELGKQGFVFEDDFVEKDIRCIPMVVRFKMDIAGIKLKLAEWSRFDVADRMQLTVQSCVTVEEIDEYRLYLQQMIRAKAGSEPTALVIDENPGWHQLDQVPGELQEKAASFQWQISLEQWKQMSNLQRFTLLKLCRPGHENKNFSKAMHEFGLGEPYLL